MQNIVKLQDALKNLSDQQLAQEMKSPSGSVPQFLIMTEMNRRSEMREEGKKAPEGTVADELVQAAQHPMGIMNLPDETLAGAAMRARISGQQQQAPGGMVAMPPQGAPQGAPEQAMPPQGAPPGMAKGGVAHFDGTDESHVTLDQESDVAPDQGDVPSWMYGEEYFPAPASSPISGSAKPNGAPAIFGGIPPLLRSKQDKYANSIKALENMLTGTGAPGAATGTGTYVPMNYPTLKPAEPFEPLEKLRDYAGETKAEQNSLIEKLTGDSEALKQRDRDMALAQAGFAIAASKNPYALGAIGEGAQTGIADYVKNRKEAKALDTERIKAQIAAAGTAGEMGQRQGIAENTLANQERMNNRDLQSRERIAESGNAVQIAIANATNGLQGRQLELKKIELAQDLQAKLATLYKPSSEVELLKVLRDNPDLAAIYKTTQGDPRLKSLAAVAANYTDPEAAAAASKKILDILSGTDTADGGNTAGGGTQYTPDQKAAILRLGGGAKGEAAARKLGLID